MPRTQRTPLRAPWEDGRTSVSSRESRPSDHPDEEHSPGPGRRPWRDAAVDGMQMTRWAVAGSRRSAAQRRRTVASEVTQAVSSITNPTPPAGGCPALRRPIRRAGASRETPRCTSHDQQRQLIGRSELEGLVSCCGRLPSRRTTRAVGFRGFTSYTHQCCHSQPARGRSRRDHVAASISALAAARCFSGLTNPSGLPNTFFFRCSVLRGAWNTFDTIVL